MMTCPHYAALYRGKRFLGLIAYPQSLILRTPITVKQEWVRHDATPPLYEPLQERHVYLIPFGEVTFNDVAVAFGTFSMFDAGVLWDVDLDTAIAPHLRSLPLLHVCRP